MIIKKFQGKTEEEATGKAREELGAKTVIMNVKELRPNGLLRMFKNSVFEVTAALEEEEAEVNPAKAMMSPLHRHDTLDMVADEKIVVPVQERPQMEFGGMMSEMSREKNSETNGLEEKLETLQNLLEQKLVDQKEEEKEDFLKEDSTKEAAAKSDG